MSASSFRQRSRSQARRFLQTAVVVDDRASLDLAVPHEVVTPGKGAAQATPAPGAPTPDSKNDLDARRLINKFAAEGVVCAVLKPDFGDGGEDIKVVETRADKATQRADIVIMDWNLRGEEQASGDEAKQLIRRILTTDDDTGTAPRRLRLVAVYTGETGLREIADELRELVAGVRPPKTEPETEPETETEAGAGKQPADRDYVVRAGPVTLVVYGKAGGTLSEQGEDLARRVGEDDLPDRLLDDFAEMTQGLLSNVALASLSAIRENTHRILSRFGSGVDAPYVAHRVLSTPPEEAEDHPVPLVASEIEGVLADAVAGLVGRDALGDWLATVADAPLGEGLNLEPDKFREALLDLAVEGLQGHDSKAHGTEWHTLVQRLRGKTNKSPKGALSDLTNRMTPEDTDGQLADMKFAVLTAVRSQYDEPHPTLRLGSIVAVGGLEDTDYRLCIQPVCDSVRIPDAEERSFPMLRMTVVPHVNKGHRVDVVVQTRADDKAESSFVKLCVSLKARHVSLLPIRPEAGRGVVSAGPPDDNGNRWFVPPGGSEPAVRWVADLKPEFAIRIAGRFAGEISRVGLTESEWLRRMAL